MSGDDKLFDQFCYAQASFESSRHIYRREHGPGQVRRFFNTSFTAFELRRYMMNYYYSKGSFTISELIEVSEFSRPTVTNTVLEAMRMGYLEELPDKIDRRRRDSTFRVRRTATPEASRRRHRKFASSGGYVDLHSPPTPHQYGQRTHQSPRRVSHGR